MIVSGGLRDVVQPMETLGKEKLIAEEVRASRLQKCQRRGKDRKHSTRRPTARDETSAALQWEALSEDEEGPGPFGGNVGTAI